MRDAPSFDVDVRSILEDLGAAVVVDADVELPTIVVGSEEFVPRHAGTLHLEVTNTGAGVVAAGAVIVEVDAVCSRCLQTFTLGVTGDIEGFYVTHEHDADLPDEQEREYIENGSIDVMPAVVSALTLEVPFAPLHDPACKGICPTCGADLNVGPCTCEPPENLSPLPTLRSLFEPPHNEE
jgi:uncharacterized protein